MGSFSKVLISSPNRKKVEKSAEKLKEKILWIDYFKNLRNVSYSAHRSRFPDLMLP